MSTDLTAFLIAVFGVTGSDTLFSFLTGDPISLGKTIHCFIFSNSRGTIPEPLQPATASSAERVHHKRLSKPGKTASSTLESLDSLNHCFRIFFYSTFKFLNTSISRGWSVCEQLGGKHMMMLFLIANMTVLYAK